MDLKPENLIAIDDNGAYKMTKIVDFGMAKNIGGGGVCCLDGTDGYKSPEQINFELRVSKLISLNKTEKN